MIVVDASFLTLALGDDGDDGEQARTRLAGEHMVAPELIDLEVAATWRRAVRARMMTVDRAQRALARLPVLPMARAPHAPLMDRIWELRDNVTPYDASYVALAELMDAPLVTFDGKLARASGPRCRFELLA